MRACVVFPCSGKVVIIPIGQIAANRQIFAQKKQQKKKQCLSHEEEVLLNIAIFIHSWAECSSKRISKGFMERLHGLQRVGRLTRPSVLAAAVPLTAAICQNVALRSRNCRLPPG